MLVFQGEIFCGAIFMQQLLGWNLYLCVVTILAIVAIYTVIGKQLYVYTCSLLMFKGFDLSHSLRNRKDKTLLAKTKYEISNIYIPSKGQLCL
ncbi:MAG: hypothetical protein AB2705_19010 [Candidatus Thiodiazotropha sp.]